MHLPSGSSFCAPPGRQSCRSPLGSAWRGSRRHGSAREAPPWRGLGGNYTRPDPRSLPEPGPRLPRLPPPPPPPPPAGAAAASGQVEVNFCLPLRRAAPAARGGGERRGSPRRAPRPRQAAGGRRLPGPRRAPGERAGAASLGPAFCPACSTGARRSRYISCIFP